MDSWLWQGIVTSVLATLLWFGGATVLTWIKHKWPRYGDLALYWVACAACLAVLWFAITGYVPFSTRPPQITPENIEANLKAWSENLGLGITKVSQLIPEQDAYFGMVVTLQSGNPVTVFRGKQKPGYLQMQCPLALSQEHLAMLNKLTKDEAHAATQEVLLELARTKLGFQMMTASGQLVAPGGSAAQPIVLQQTIVIMKAAPITNDLTEATFAQHINEIDSAIAIVRGSTELTLQRYSHLHDSAGAVRVTQQ